MRGGQWELGRSCRTIAIDEKVHVGIGNEGPGAWLTMLSVALVGLLLRSPIYNWFLVPAARNTMVVTAEKNGIDWGGAKAWIQSVMSTRDSMDKSATPIPSYYRMPFHTYPEGNLCWDAAFEQELAGKAVGIRNFPAKEGGNAGEELFRGALEQSLERLHAQVPAGATVVDLGCGTGTSTRRVASLLPQAKRVIGVDLSPQMVAVGQTLLKGAASRDEGGWIEAVMPDHRIELRVADAAQTGLPDASVDLVSLCLVLHELPPDAARDIFAEAFRILRPGGIFWCAEMDGRSPGYAELRQNPALFALIRATEPYLDLYFDAQEELLLTGFRDVGFEEVEVSAGTGRHFTAVAKKGTAPPGQTRFLWRDVRWDASGKYTKDDTHLHTLDTEDQRS